MEGFCYLGSWLSTNGNCDKDCQIRFGKGYKMYGGTNTSVSKVKVRLYESLVMSTMLYSAELWLSLIHI